MEADFRSDVRHGPGVCRTVKRFRVAWLEELAKAVEAEFQRSFEAHRARIAISPVKVSALTTVGEGVALELIPDDPKTWEWWGDFESELEVRRRPRFSQEWQDINSPSETENWLRSEAHRYLRHLQGADNAGH